MYGSSLILLPDDCDLLVKRWRKKKAVPAPTPVPPQPQPAPVSSKGFKQKQSTYRLSVAPSGRARCRRCRTVIAKGRNPTRGLRLCEAWAVHAALALHRARVH